jgi:thioredoxin-related protein
MKHLLRFLILFFVAISISSFVIPNKELINWITLEELEERYAANPKPVLIDIYTDWCGWCKEMDRTTYSNKKLAAYVNEKYYAVKFNAEIQTPVKFNNKIYNYNKQQRTNELAIYLTSGQLAYPTTVFMAGRDKQPAPLPGYLKAKEMEAPLKYFGEKADVNQTFVAFNKNLKKGW